MPLVWTPLLTGTDAARAQQACDAIAEALAEWPLSNDPSLGSGAAGLALMFGSFAGARVPELEHWIDAAVQSEEFQTLGLHSGYSGLGLAIELLARRGFVSDDVNVEIDAVIGDVVAADAWPGELDLLAGITGIGVYALTRRKTDQRLVEHIVRHLDAAANRSDDGAVWWTPYQWLPSGHRPAFPNGYANLGLAHGQPGIIAFLAQASSTNPHARPLLDESVRWVLAHQLDDGGFGRWDAAGYSADRARLAWCYGDLGVASALLLASEITGKTEWRETALDLAMQSAARDMELSGVIDAGLCHGAAGVAHMFNRIYHSTSLPVFADAARRWFVRTLDMSCEGIGIGGYRSWQRDDFDHPFRWVDDPGLLTGAAGIALALDAATHSVAPDWDSIFLLSAVPA